MNAHTPRRGDELLAHAGHDRRGGADKRRTLRILSRIMAMVGPRLLDQIDARLAHGAIHAILPDGSARILGGRGAGAECVVVLHDWRALWRLVTGGSVGWYQAWEAGEWDSPDPVPLFALTMANAANLRGTARAHGPWRWTAKAVHWAHRNSRAGSNFPSVVNCAKICLDAGVDSIEHGAAIGLGVGKIAHQPSDFAYSR